MNSKFYLSSTETIFVYLQNVNYAHMALGSDNAKNIKLFDITIDLGN